MENKAKIRINLNLREFEIEGSEDFINSHSENIESFLEILKTTMPTNNQQPVVITKSQTSQTNQPPLSNSTAPDNFGEYYHQVPKTTKEADKILVAGHYAQLTSGENLFSTKDANKLLLDQGIKLSNPAVFMNQIESAKYIIKLSKGKYRVSKTGTDRIQQIFTGTIETK